MVGDLSDGWTYANGSPMAQRAWMWRERSRREKRAISGGEERRGMKWCCVVGEKKVQDSKGQRRGCDKERTDG